MFDLNDDPTRRVTSFNWLWPLQFGSIFVNVGKSLLLILLIVILYRLVSSTIETLSRRNRVPETLALFLRRLCRGVAIALASIIVLQTFGILSDVWVIVSAILATFAVGFIATWSILSNIFCWVVIVASQPFYIGQTIEIVSDNIRGRVRDIDLIYTVLEEANGNLLMIPNSLLLQRSIRRFAAEPPASAAEPPVTTAPR